MLRPMPFALRLGAVATTGAALVLLVGYLVVVNHEANVDLRQQLLAHREEQLLAEADVLGHLLGSAAEELGHVDVDLGGQLPPRQGPAAARLRERLRLVVGSGDHALFARLAVLDDRGAIALEVGRPGAPTALPALPARGGGGVAITPDGGALVLERALGPAARPAGRLVAWLRQEAVVGRLAPGQRGGAALVVDGAGHAYLPDGARPAPITPAQVRGLPARGRAVVTGEGPGGGSWLAWRAPVPGQALALVRLEPAAELLGSQGGKPPARQLAAVAAALGAILLLSAWLTVRALVLRTELREALRREHEVGAKHRALAREVAERQRLESARALLARAVEQASEAIAITDSRGCLEYANARFLALAGAEPVLGRRVSEVLAVRPAAALEELGRSLSGSDGWRGELVAERAGGRVELELASSPVLDAAGTTTNHVLVARDVTEERALREQLRHAQKLEAIGTLAGGVAHDFNNLLAAVKANAEFVLERIPPGDPVRADVEEIDRAATRAAALTRQLLAFGRKQVLRPVAVDLDEVVAGTEKLLRRLLGEDIEIATELGPEPRRVRADPGQLQQVLINLAVNARDAMPGGGRLTLRTDLVTVSELDARRHADARPGPYVRLTVSDTGGGIDPRIMGRIFEPFFTTKGVGKGTGLGLSTVYGIVAQSQGFLEVQSEPGRGARFDVYLPADRRVAEAPSNAPAQPAAAPQGRGEIVLVVEDERSVLAVIERRLAAEGFQVLGATDGREALELAERRLTGRVDVLLSDVVMPHVSGPELARRFRELHPEVVVVFMSGYSEEAVARHGDLDAAAAFVQKPSGLPGLAGVLRAALDAAQQRRSA